MIRCVKYLLLKIHDGRNKKISIIIACFNERTNILPLYERLIRVMQPLQYTFEIIFVDNDSTDGSWEIFHELTLRDKRVTVICMSRNFGYSQTSYFAGLKYCSGDSAILLDGDIQDPPEMIPQFLEKWEEGNEAVYGIRKKRKASPLRRAGYKVFYRLFRKLAYFPVPLDASDFGLLDRKIINELVQFSERDIFIRGIRPYIGFRQTGIEYERKARAGGQSSFTIFSDIFVAKRLILNFSYKPLQWISRFAFFVVLLAVVAIVVYFAWTLIRPDAPRGIPTIILFILFFNATQLLCISVIGEYLGKVIEEIKHRPRFIVRQIMNNTRDVSLSDFHS